MIIMQLLYPLRKRAHICSGFDLVYIIAENVPMNYIQIFTKVVRGFSGREECTTFHGEGISFKADFFKPVA